MLKKLKTRIARGYAWHTRRTLPVMITANRAVVLALLILGAWLWVSIYFPS